MKQTVIALKHNEETTFIVADSASDSAILQEVQSLPNFKPHILCPQVFSFTNEDGTVVEGMLQKMDIINVTGDTIGHTIRNIASSK